VPNANMAETKKHNTYLNIRDLDTWKMIMGD
jgi:hypothetical protein